MTLLQIRAADRPDTLLSHATEPDAVRDALARRGMRFERWSTAPDPARLAAFRDDHGFRAFESAVMTPPANPVERAEAEEARDRLLEEHWHAEDEGWLFVRGRSCFYLHVGRAVCIVVCDAGDLLTVPRGTRHWFDMGWPPDFRAWRFYSTQPGFVAEFTGSALPRHFPRMLDLPSPTKEQPAG